MHSLPHLLSQMGESRVHRTISHAPIGPVLVPPEATRPTETPRPADGGLSRPAQTLS